MHLRDTALYRMAGANELLHTLRNFNIRHVEQLAYLLDSSAGVRTLTEAFRGSVDWKEVKRLLQASNMQAISMPGLSKALSFDRYSRPGSVFTNFAYGLAADRKAEYEYKIFSRIPERFSQDEDEASLEYKLNKLEAALFAYSNNAPMEELSSRVCLHREGAFPPPKDQGRRGTCAAFAVSAQLQLFIREHIPSFRRVTDFSEQFIYYIAKKKDGRLNEEGTTLNAVLTGIQEEGVCSQSTLPYRSYVDWAQQLLFDQSFDLRHVSKLAKGTKIADFGTIPAKDRVDWIKRCLRCRLPVSLGVLTFKEAWGNDFAIWRGEIGLPLTRNEEDGSIILLDDCDGGHAVCVVGYVDQLSDQLTSRPGGGYFIFRNSWGENWATDSSDGRGYGTLPYEYVVRYGVEACVITGVTTTTSRDDVL